MKFAAFFARFTRRKPTWVSSRCRYCDVLYVAKAPQARRMICPSCQANLTTEPTPAPLFRPRQPADTNDAFEKVKRHFLK
jgi:uncharacterized paraquat-inducible protein A